MSTDFQLARGRVLHFNEDSWDALQDALASRGWSLMARHVAEQRTKDVVVLDLDDPNLVGCSAVTPTPDKVAAALMGTNSVAAHAIARQIEAQTKPPRIPEPGLWGVVSDSSGNFWVCNEPGRWTRTHDGVNWPWCDVDSPTLVRPGIEDES